MDEDNQGENYSFIMHGKCIDMHTCSYDGFSIRHGCIDRNRALHSLFLQCIYLEQPQISKQHDTASVYT